MRLSGETAGIISATISLAALIPYIISILKKNTIPNRITWIIWSFSGLIIIASYYASGARNELWLPIGYTAGQIIIMILSFRYGVKKWSFLDKICLIGAVFSLFLWWVFSSAGVALIINVIIDFFGAIPTIVKSYKFPKTENAFSWILTAVASWFNLFTITKLTFLFLLYPTYMFLANTLIALLALKPFLWYKR